MKKVAVVALFACFSVQAEASVSAYLRAAVAGVLTNSDFDMHYSVDKDNFAGANPSATNKKHSIGNVGGELALGIKTKFEDDWFLGGEFNYSLKKVKHKHDFIEAEDAEGDALSTDSHRISYIDVKHENEYGLALRFGKHFDGYDIYGICGATTKNVDVNYSLDANHPNIGGGKADLKTNHDKRVWGMMFGLGASKKINDTISCSMEYKYKTYNSATKSVDWRKETKSFFNKDHDNSNRDFKVKSDSHELSIGFTMNV